MLTLENCALDEGALPVDYCVVVLQRRGSRCSSSQQLSSQTGHDSSEVGTALPVCMLRAAKVDIRRRRQDAQDDSLATLV